MRRWLRGCRPGDGHVEGRPFGGRRPQRLLNGGLDLRLEVRDPGEGRCRSRRSRLFSTRRSAKVEVAIADLVFPTSSMALRHGRFGAALRDRSPDEVADAAELCRTGGQHCEVVAQHADGGGKRPFSGPPVASDHEDDDCRQRKQPHRDPPNPLPQPTAPFPDRHHDLRRPTRLTAMRRLAANSHGAFAHPPPRPFIMLRSAHSAQK